MASTPLVLALSILLMHNHNAIAVNLRRQQPGRTKTESNQKQITPKQIIEPETSSIATVNGVEISPQKFNRLYEARASKLGAKASHTLPMVALGIKAAIAGRMIDELLVEQEAERRRVTASDAEVSYALKEFENSFPNADAFRKHLSSVDDGDVGLREQIRLRVLREKLAGINPNETVSDGEVKEFYDENRFRFNLPAHLTVQDIVFLVGPNATAEIDYAQREKANRALQLAKKPEVSFPGLAIQQSEGKTAKAGGDLGQVTEQSIDASRWTELTRMQPGQISGVIRAADGYHILRLLRRNPEVRQTQEQATEEIKTNIRLRVHSAKLAELMIALRAKAKIKNHFLRRYPQAEPRHFQTKTGGAPAESGSSVNPSVVLRPGPAAGPATSNANPDRPSNP